MVQNLPAIRRPGFNPWVGKIPLKKGMATHSSILARRIPRKEEPGGPQCVDHRDSDTADRLNTFNPVSGTRVFADVPG